MLEEDFEGHLICPKLEYDKYAILKTHNNFFVTRIAVARVYRH
jgi:hypothetical protein